MDFIQLFNCTYLITSYHMNKYIIIGLLFLSFEFNAQVKNKSDRTDSLLYWIENVYFNYASDGYLATTNHIGIDMTRKGYADLDILDLNEFVQPEKNRNLKLEVREVFKSDSVDLRLIVPADSLFHIINCENNKSNLSYTKGSKTKLLEIDLIHIVPRVMIYLKLVFYYLAQNSSKIL